MKILITGSTGFVGKVLYQNLKKLNHDLILPVRKSSSRQHISIGDFSKKINWAEHLSSCDVVIHLASIAHRLFSFQNNFERYYSVNVDATVNLAKEAASCGVKRFIFLSTIKVNGDFTLHGKKFNAKSKVNPISDYAITKCIAERKLLEIGKRTGMEIVIIRPPLVYGYGVKGYLRLLITAINFYLPLPLGVIKTNKRSLVFVKNLTDFIIHCAFSRKKLSHSIFLVSDDNDLSTHELLMLISCSMNKKIILLNIKKRRVYALFKFFGATNFLARLFGNLQVDISQSYKKIGWVPQYTVYDGFKDMRKK
jgi:UDP-glucose 4-epimerase